MFVFVVVVVVINYYQQVKATRIIFKKRIVCLIEKKTKLKNQNGQ
jgi:hypothetical protein